MARRQIARCFLIPYRNVSRPLKQSFHSSIPVSVTIPLPLDIPDTVDSRVSIRTRKLEGLQACLSWRIPNPSRVWAAYIGTVNTVGARDIPLGLHKLVLRKCTASRVEIRVAAAKYLNLSSTKTSTHIHEERFRTVIRNIRSGGWAPSLEDYHFILGQFAAVGHYAGSMNVYQELLLKGPFPESKTYELCLQAIAHRLTLPCSKLQKPVLMTDTRKLCASLLNDMSTKNISLTSTNLDFAIRILKDTLDRKAFESLLKVAYGIDLTHPDRVSVTNLDNVDFHTIFSAVLGESPILHPFSTSALNTVIDILGRLGDMSKLVQAFETLTQPLPARALQQYSPSFDDDDSVVLEATPEVRPPYATPNTTTYNILLKYISKAGHAVLARHYLLQAIELEWQLDRALRGDLMRRPLHEVAAPHFAINRGMLLSVFGQSNRDKNTQLMRWLQSKLSKVLRRKRLNLAWHTRFRANLLDMQQFEPSPADNTKDILSKVNSQISASCPPSSSFPPSVVSNPMPQRNDRSGRIPAIEIDLDILPTQSYPFRPFDANTHLRVLRRDLEEIDTFAAYVNNVMGRTTQRVKERIGRRVWQDKDIYLLTQNTRVKISRPTWQEIVNFRSRYGLSLKVAAEPPS